MTCVYTGVACLAFFVILSIWNWIRMRRIAASRPGENFDTFRASFTPEEALPEVLQAAYAKFQEWCASVPDFPVRADDDIGSIYGMVDEDLDDALLEALKDCARRLPPEDQLQATTERVESVPNADRV